MSGRGKNPNSLANLSKGRTKGHGKDRESNAIGGDANTFKALIEAVGSCDLSDELWARMKSSFGIDKAWCKARGITQYRKLAKVVGMYLDDSPQNNKELMERSEGKVKEQVELSGEVALKGYANVSPDDWDEANAPD